jgi:hypothetical protein
MIVIFIAIQRTQPVIQGVWPSVLVMGTVKWPPIQQNMLVTNPQPIDEIALTYAYCQRVGHKFKYCPFVDDKLKQLIKK